MHPISCTYTYCNTRHGKPWDGYKHKNLNTLKMKYNFSTK